MMMRRDPWMMSDPYYNMGAMSKYPLAGGMGNFPVSNWDRARTGFGFPTSTSRMFDMMDRMMDDMMTDMGANVPTAPWQLGGPSSRQLLGGPLGVGRAGMGYTPPIECRQEDDGFHFSLEAPGMKPDDMDVSIDKGVLTIKGERSSDAGRTTRTFEKWMRVPEDADIESDKVIASHDNGIISVFVPTRTPEASKRQRKLTIQKGPEAAKLKN